MSIIQENSPSIEVKVDALKRWHGHVQEYSPGTRAWAMRIDLDRLFKSLGKMPRVEVKTTRLLHWMDLLQHYGDETPAGQVYCAVEDHVLADLAYNIEAAIMRRLMDADIQA